MRIGIWIQTTIVTMASEIERKICVLASEAKIAFCCLLNLLIH